MPERRLQLLRFSVVGAAGFAVDVGVLYVALVIGLGPFVGRILSFLVAVRATWELNRRFTFAALDGRTASGSWWRYLLAMLGGGVANYAVYSTLVVVLSTHPLAPLLGVTAGAVAGLAINFAGARLFVFRD